MAQVKVIGGDICKGAWQFTGMFGKVSMWRSTPDHLWAGERIDLSADVERIEQLTEESVKRLAGTAGWGIAGALIAGPLGAIGGMLLGGNKAVRITRSAMF